MSLKADDLEVGMFVTILDHGEITALCVKLSGDGAGIPAIATIANPNTEGCGDVFKIMAIDLPFIAVVEVVMSQTSRKSDDPREQIMSIFGGIMGAPTPDSDNEAKESRPMSLDTRQITLKRLSAEYVMALAGVTTEVPGPVDTSWLEASFNGKDEEEDDD
jgi:hypothetical protein